MTLRLVFHSSELWRVYQVKQWYDPVPNRDYSE